MSRDVRELLHRAAADPAEGLDIDELRRQGRRVEARHRAAVAGGTAVVLLLVVVGGVLGGRELTGPPDVAVENGRPTDSSQPASGREAVALEVARAVAGQVDLSALPDGEEIETVRDALGTIPPPQGVERVRPGAGGTVWAEQGQPTRVAASAAVVPAFGEPYCIIVSLASDGTVAAAPASGDPDWGCRESAPTVATDDPLLQQLRSEADMATAIGPAGTVRISPELDDTVERAEVFDPPGYVLEQPLAAAGYGESGAVAIEDPTGTYDILAVTHTNTCNGGFAWEVQPAAQGLVATVHVLPGPGACFDLAQGRVLGLDFSGPVPSSIEVTSSAP